MTSRRSDAASTADVFHYTEMGLHLCYELSLPRGTPAADVTERVRLLHEAAARLPFARVSALVQATAGEALGDVSLFDCSLEDFFRLWARIRLGFGVTVRDEMHYWETRAAGRLVAEVREMNRIVARVAGAMHDVVGEQARTEGAIFRHPEFEVLETEGPSS